MAAVIRALQIALARDEEEEPGRRVMICTDSQATMRAMETAWRKGRHTGERLDRKGLVATMVELRREICKIYDTIEALREDKMVYKAVKTAILAAHQEDGATMADITRETKEQRRQGRIKYLVVVEMRKVNTQGQGEKVDTRDKSRDVTEGTQREQGGAGETEGAAEKHGEMVCSNSKHRETENMSQQ